MDTLILDPEKISSPLDESIKEEIFSTETFQKSLQRYKDRKSKYLDEKIINVLTNVEPTDFDGRVNLRDELLDMASEGNLSRLLEDVEIKILQTDQFATEDKYRTKLAIEVQFQTGGEYNTILNTINQIAGHKLRILQAGADKKQEIQKLTAKRDLIREHVDQFHSELQELSAQDNSDNKKVESLENEIEKAKTKLAEANEKQENIEISEIDLRLTLKEDSTAFLSPVQNRLYFIIYDFEKEKKSHLISQAKTVSIGIVLLTGLTLGSGYIYKQAKERPVVNYVKPKEVKVMIDSLPQFRNNRVVRHFMTEEERNQLSNFRDIDKMVDYISQAASRKFIRDSMPGIVKEYVEKLQGRSITKLRYVKKLNVIQIFLNPIVSTVFQDNALYADTFSITLSNSKSENEIKPFYVKEKNIIYWEVSPEFICSKIKIHGAANYSLPLNQAANVKMKIWEVDSSGDHKKLIGRECGDKKE